MMTRRHNIKKQNSPKTKNGSSVFSRSSTTTMSPGKSFLTENRSFGSEAEGLCMMLRSFSLKNGKADTVTLFILHSISCDWSSSVLRLWILSGLFAKIHRNVANKHVCGPILSDSTTVSDPFPYARQLQSVECRQREEEERGGTRRQSTNIRVCFAKRNKQSSIRTNPQMCCLMAEGHVLHRHAAYQGDNCCKDEIGTAGDPFIWNYPYLAIQLSWYFSVTNKLLLKGNVTTSIGNLCYDSNY